MAIFDPTTPEVWYLLPDFPLYQISSHLRLKSHHLGNKRGRRNLDGRLIKVHTDDRGYRKLLLWKDGKYHNRYLHRVVAEMEFGPIPDGLQVLHRDDDKSNNWPWNLKFGTQTENVADCKANGHFRVAVGQDSGNASLDNRSARAILRLHAYGVDCYVLAESFGLALETIYGIRDGERWTHIDTGGRS